MEYYNKVEKELKELKNTKSTRIKEDD